MHSNLLPFPVLTKSQQQAIINCYFANKDYAKHPLDNKFINYRNLYNWPSKTSDLSYVIDELNLGKYLPYMSIQRIVGPIFPAHIDANRLCSAICTVKGLATTIFYKEDHPVQKIVMELGCWYLFDNSTRHAVFDIEDDRISLCIDLTPLFTNFTQASDFFSKNTYT